MMEFSQVLMIDGLEVRPVSEHGPAIVSAGRQKVGTIDVDAHGLVVYVDRFDPKSGNTVPTLVGRFFGLPEAVGGLRSARAEHPQTRRLAVAA